MQEATLIRIAVADDHAMFRIAIAKLIDTWENCKVTIQASNGKQLLDKLCPALLPDLAIIDIHMPELNGYETITILRQKYPGLNILAISSYQSEEMIWQLIKCGANGFVSKSEDVDKLRKAIYEINRAGYFFSDHAASRMVRRSFNNGIVAEAHLLDKIETAFLKILCTEKTYKQISSDLGIPERQTEYLRNRMFERFGVKSRTALALAATQKGLIV